ELKRAFIAHLEGEKRSSPNTVAAYGRDLDGLFAFLEEKAAAEPRRSRRASLDVYVLRGWLGELVRTCKPPTIARKSGSVRAFCRWMKQKGHADLNPATELALPKSRRELPTFLSAEDAAVVMQAPDPDHTGALRAEEVVALRDRALLELLYAGGLRVS